MNPNYEDIDLRMNFWEKFKVAYWIFGLIVVILMIVLGFFLLFSDYFNYLTWNVRIAFALFLISFGAFRIVNIVLKSRKQKNKDEDEKE